MYNMERWKEALKENNKKLEHCQKNYPPPLSVCEPFFIKP